MACIRKLLVLQRQHATPENCYRLGVSSYSSDPSGDRVCPLEGAPGTTVKQYDGVAEYATQQRLSMTAKTVYCFCGVSKAVYLHMEA